MIPRSTNEEFIKKLSDVNKNIEPLEGYINCATKIRFKCLIDGNIFSSTPNNVLRGHGCPLCGKKKGSERATRTKLENNQSVMIGNKYPHLIKYLKNKEDAYLYGYSSAQKIVWICSTCNFEFMKSPSSMQSGDFICPNCIKNDSYPNRFMFNILTQLDIEFEREYSPDWIKPKRYDFYIPQYKLIIEMDGRLHNNQEAKINDNYKDEIASSHGLKIVRISCDYRKTEERYDVVSRNIRNSELLEYYNFDDINWDEANCFALKNEVSNVCELWEKYHDLDKIRDKTKLTLYTIKKYLNFGRENKMCSYDNEKCMIERRKQRILNSEHGRSVMVQCDQTGEIFPNMKLAGKKYNCNVSSFFYNHGKSAGQLPDGTKLTWTKIPKEVS